MKRKLVILAILVTGFTSACTTIAAPGFGGKREVAINTEADTVKAGSIAALADAYIAKYQKMGWTKSADASQSSSKIMGFLSRGISALKSDGHETDPDEIYLKEAGARLKTDNVQTILLTDIGLAGRETRTLVQQVNAITNSAHATSSLRVDAGALEQALLTAHKARRQFVSIAQKHNVLDVQMETALAGFDDKINMLADQANALDSQEAAPAVG